MWVDIPPRDITNYTWTWYGLKIRYHNLWHLKCQMYNWNFKWNKTSWSKSISNGYLYSRQPLLSPSQLLITPIRIKATTENLAATAISPSPAASLPLFSHLLQRQTVLRAHYLFGRICKCFQRFCFTDKYIWKFFRFSLVVVYFEKSL